MKAASECLRIAYEPLNADTEARIRRFLADPTADNWDGICNIVLGPSGEPWGTTVWQAVRELDPSFPARGRTFGADNGVLEEWSRVPEPSLVLRAIKLAG